MTKKLKIKKLIRILSIVLILASVIGAITVSALYTPTQIKVIRSVENINTIVNKADKPEIHYSASQSAFTEKVASSGLIELFVDPKTVSFGIFETGNNRFWSALPLLDSVATGEELVSDASMATLRILGGSDIYYLNTQDNSLFFNKSSYEKIENGVKFIYDLFPDKQTADKKEFSKNDIGFRLVISVTLKDGSMLVNCTHENLTKNPDAFIESIDLFNTFGAYNDSLEDDFLLVPDGCGAIIKTSIYDESFESVSFNVYGNDPSSETEATGDAIIPAFGIKHGKTAFVSLIEKADAIAKVKAEKATSLTEYNRVYPSFNITPIQYKDEKLYISEKSYNDEISLCYRFLTGINATYPGLASACREQLIRNSVLSTKNVDASDYLPFFLTLGASVTTDSGLFNTVVPLTTFEQATDMLTHMKSKGINNINVRYTGVFNGGPDSSVSSSPRLNNESGGEKGLSELIEYTSKQKMNVYFDVNLLSGNNVDSDDAIRDILRNEAMFTPSSFTSEYFDSTPESRLLKKADSIKNTISALISETETIDFSGYCINDAASVLYSDFTKDGLNRQDAASTVSTFIAPLSTGKSTMAVNGNFYMLKTVDSIINMPLEVSASKSGAYVSVPFVPLVLHGIVDYTGEPINTQINKEETMLKYVEYGACPHFAWSYEPISDNAETDKFYYDTTVNSAAEYYQKADSVLNDLRDARMTDHYAVADGIFCTEYDTGSLIYVNYTDESYEILGVTVEARSFTRVN